MKEQLAKAIEKAIELAEKTGEFVLDQAPDLIHQFLLYQTIEKSVIMLIGVGFIFLPIAIKKLLTEVDKDYYDRFNFLGKMIDGDIAPPIWIISILSLFIGIYLLILNLLAIIKILVAPKIYIIEYFIN